MNRHREIFVDKNFYSNVEFARLGIVSVEQFACVCDSSSTMTTCN
jgi:hypothetical protein